MKAQWRQGDTRPEREFIAQECPWVRPGPDGGIQLTYYESVTAAREGGGQGKLTLILNEYEREKLKELL